MPRIVFRDEEIELEKSVARSDFSKPTIRLEHRIKEYIGSRRISGEAAVVYDSLVECFALHILARKKFSALLGNSSESKLLSTLYSLNVGARHGKQILDGIDGNGKDLMIETYGDEGNNIFLENFEVDTNGNYPRQYNQVLKNLAEVLDSDKTAKDLSELAIDFYEFIESSTSRIAADGKFTELNEVLKKNPLQYKNNVYAGFSDSMDLEQKKDGSLDWKDFIGYSDFIKRLKYYENTIKKLDTTTKKYQKRLDKLLPNMLLIGPTGCGKTFGVEILASKLSDYGVPFNSIDISDVLDSYKDGAAKKLSMVFQRATLPLKKGLCKVSVLYIDEGDPLIKKRYGSRASDEDAKVTNIFLSNTGKNRQQQGLIVIVSSNLGGIISVPARRRFGMINRVSYPDINTQAELFKYFVESWQKGDEDVFSNIDYIKVAQTAFTSEAAKSSPRKRIRYCAGDIENIVDNAAVSAIDNEHKTGKFVPVTTKDLFDEIKEYTISRRFENEEYNA